MNHPEDEKLEELGMEIPKHKVGSPGRMCAQARYGGFRDGAAHVRTSAEWKAMERVVVAAIAAESIYWDFEKSMKKEAVNLKSTLQELDRIRKEGESG